MPTAMLGTLPRPNRQVCYLFHSPIMLQCMSPFVMWWTVPAPGNEVP